MRSFVVALIVASAAAVALPSGDALACSCDDEPLASYADQVIAAFVGTQTGRVVEDESVDNGAALTFAVTEVFTGDVPAEYEVRTHADGDACGIDVGGQGAVGMVVFEFQGEPTVGACPPTYERAELVSVFGQPAPPEGTTPSEPVSPGPGDSESSAFARLVLAGGLLALLAVGTVMVRSRRRRTTAG